jgi:hypothetical protein
MDDNGMWSDTALVVTTDHGFLLGEHSWWAKNVMPCYEEVAHIPLFIHHPDFGDQAGTRRAALTQTIDLMPTLLDLHGVAQPAEVTGTSLIPLLSCEKTSVREAVIYGVFGSAVNVTDGRYTLFLYPPQMHRAGLYQYTLMPMHMKELFAVEELQDAQLAPPFPFTKGVPLLRVPATPKSPNYKLHGPASQNDTVTVMFDLSVDPRQERPLTGAPDHERLCDHIVRLMKQNDAPAEYFDRLGLAA